MRNIALLGQLTVIYAKPNMGKTLLTIHFIIDAIINKIINAEDVFYINADDTFNGLIEKSDIAEKYNFHMLAPSHNDFEVGEFIGYMQRMIDEGTANGIIIILDTLKKFADLMDKKDSTKFMNTARSFSSNGGTLILLAHTNKNRDNNGKVIAGGTSDIIDDADCAYTLDEVNHKNEIKTVLFENKKLRGNVALESSYTYSTACNQTYQERLNSIVELDKSHAQDAKQASSDAADMKKDQPVVDAIIEAITLRPMLKGDVVKKIKKDGFSTRRINEALKKYEKKSSLQVSQWQILPSDKNSKIYALLNYKAPEIATAEKYIESKNGEK